MFKNIKSIYEYFKWGKEIWDLDVQIVKKNLVWIEALFRHLADEIDCGREAIGKYADTLNGRNFAFGKEEEFANVSDAEGGKEE